MREQWWAHIKYNRMNDIRWKSCHRLMQALPPRLWIFYSSLLNWTDDYGLTLVCLSVCNVYNPWFDQNWVQMVHTPYIHKVGTTNKACKMTTNKADRQRVKIGSIYLKRSGTSIRTRQFIKRSKRQVTTMSQTAAFWVDWSRSRWQRRRPSEHSITVVQPRNTTQHRAGIACWIRRNELCDMARRWHRRIRYNPRFLYMYIFHNHVLTVRLELLQP